MSRNDSNERNKRYKYRIKKGTTSISAAKENL